MTPNLRFIVWIVIVAALTLTQHVGLSLAPVTLAACVAAAVLATGLVIALVGLILTTPSDAIILPRWQSVVVLTALTAALFAHAWWRTGRDPRTAVADGIVVVSAGLFAWRAARRGVTPWWVAPLFWNPLAVGPFAGPPWAIAVLAVVLIVAFDAAKSARD